MNDESWLCEKYHLLWPHLDERSKRLIVAADAAIIGYGGIATVARASGLSRPTIRHGLRELYEEQVLPNAKVRQSGGGRRLIEEVEPEVLTALKSLVEATKRGDPESPLVWTTNSCAHLAEVLCSQGHDISPPTVARLLHQEGFSLQGLVKTLEGNQAPDRDAQFQHIATRAQAFFHEGQPVISIDAKKKELIGPYFQKGREWHTPGRPEHVNVYDFENESTPRALPYGIYDVEANQGWVSVGIDHLTTAFAAESIYRWWIHLGRGHYPQATRLLICADGGPPNSSRGKLWKWHLSQLAELMHLEIAVSHYPPGASKWNTIEHQLFSEISLQWRGRPLQSYSIMVQLIKATTTTTGLTVSAELDERGYARHEKVSKEQWAQVRVEGEDFHPEWNYTIKASNSSDE